MDLLANEAVKKERLSRKAEQARKARVIQKSKMENLLKIKEDYEKVKQIILSSEYSDHDKITLLEHLIVPPLSPTHPTY